MFLSVKVPLRECVIFGPDGQVIPIEGKVPGLFTRDLRTYRDLPEPLSAAVGRALATQCSMIALGYRHGASDPLFEVTILPGSGLDVSVAAMDSKNVYVLIEERQPKTVPFMLSVDLAIPLGDEYRLLSHVYSRLSAKTPELLT